MLLTPTVTQESYITTNRTTAVATLSNSDTTDYYKKRTIVVATLINTETTELLQ